MRQEAGGPYGQAMKRLIAIVAAALAAQACGSGAPDNHAGTGDTAADMSSDHASAARFRTVFQLPVLGGRPGAGFFAIDVPDDHGALIRVTSPQAARIEMHETVRNGSMSGMRRVDRVEPELRRIVMRHGGLHLMLFDVDPQLTAGGDAQFVLHFERGQTRSLDAHVVEAGGAHDGH